MSIAAVEEDVFAYKGSVWARYRASLGDLQRVEQHIAEFDPLFNDPQCAELKPEEVHAVVKTLVGGMDSDIIRFVEDWLVEERDSAMNARVGKENCYSFFAAAVREFNAAKRQWN